MLWFIKHITQWEKLIPNRADILHNYFKNSVSQELLEKAFDMLVSF